MKYERAAISSICRWIDLAERCNRVNIKIAHFLTLSSNTCSFLYDFVQGLPVFFGPDKIVPILLKMHLALLITGPEKLNSSPVVQMKILCHQFSSVFTYSVSTRSRSLQLVEPYLLTLQNPILKRCWQNCNCCRS